MKGIVGAVAVAVLLAGAARADDKKIDPDKLVGKWELTKSGSNELPKGTIVMFTKDNKVTVSIMAKDMKLDISGTYKIDGEKITFTIKMGDVESTETNTIKTLTDDTVVFVDKDGKEDELKKVKEKEKEKK
ncbi:MAG TPA: TIGR03066 family protein [Gemmataceae bacterium]|nr:TIGR03066 family protein [Gemmataceae bacterium]